MQVLVHPNRAGLLALCALIVGAANVPCCLIAAPAAAPTFAAPAQSSSPYTKGPKTRDGIGVYYFGREIAHYMTHHGAPWLERGEREIEERPDLVMKALALKPGDIVADLGCGTGYFSWRMAQAVAPAGIVYGVEIQTEMLALLDVLMQQRGVTNGVGVLGINDAFYSRLTPAERAAVDAAGAKALAYNRQASRQADQPSLMRGSMPSRCRPQVCAPSCSRPPSITPAVRA